MKKKVTLAYLEALLKNESDIPLRVMPNGEIRAMTKKQIKDKNRKPITLNEDLGGEYGVAA